MSCGKKLLLRFFFFLDTAYKFLKFFWWPRIVSYVKTTSNPKVNGQFTSFSAKITLGIKMGDIQLFLSGKIVGGNPCGGMILGLVTPEDIFGSRVDVAKMAAPLAVDSCVL